jgi:predicted acetyltransferase
VLSLYVEQDRRQGTATKLMNMLLEEAKELDVDVIEFSAMSFDVED